MVTLATAHPAKFPDAVERATGLRPRLPPHLADLLDRPERFTTSAQPAPASVRQASTLARTWRVSSACARIGSAPTTTSCSDGIPVRRWWPRSR